ncbi:MAG: hypothetical protein ACNI25_02590 [Halarcobacter sp.]
MGKFFISLLFLTFTLATIIGISRYYENKVDNTSTLSLAQIEQIMKQNPSASGDNITGQVSGLVNDDTSSEIEDKDSFKFLDK